MRRIQTKKIAIYFMAATMTMVSSVCMHGITAKANDTLVTEEGEIADELQVGEMEVLSGNVSIDEVHFPDENFRNYVNENFDTDGDGNLSDEEIKNITRLSVYRKNISSLQGIEYFPQLEYLECDANEIRSIDLSKNTQLEYLECDRNKLRSIDLSKNTKLEYLLCEYNNIKKLDLSNNTLLSYLSCHGNEISNLDLSNNINLNSIHCGEKALKTLDLSNNKKINFIYGDITLDTGNRYDLSQINWLKTENIAEISFGFYDDEGYSNRDEQSYLSGSIINIIDHDDGIIDITEYNDEKYGSLKAISLYYTTALDAAEVNPGIFVLEADKNHFLAGIATACSDEDKSRLSYSWVAQDESGNFINVSDWDKSEWVEWTPEKFGIYKIFGKVRVDESDELVYTTVALYEYHPYIKGKCQMPYSSVAPGEPGYLIGVESYENPNQSYQFEMLILDCTLHAQGLPAWTHTTGKFTVPEGNAGWCVWQPQYGYYWTLFRVYDGEGNLIDEWCYPFENIC